MPSTGPRRLLLTLVVLLLLIPTVAHADTLLRPLGVIDRLDFVYKTTPVYMYIEYDVDCDGWSIQGYTTGVLGPDLTIVDTEVVTPWFWSGTWSNPSVLESIPYLYRSEFQDTSDFSTFTRDLSGSIQEPAECQVGPAPTNGSALSPAYFMYTLQDAGQPQGWAPFCYIISNHGYPSVDRQATLCSVPGSGHTFQATNAPYAGWVYIDGAGNASYGWPAWNPAWYRPEFRVSDPPSYKESLGG
jgi:hypothetical protein